MRLHKSVLLSCGISPYWLHDCDLKKERGAEAESERLSLGAALKREGFPMANRSLGLPMLLLALLAAAPPQPGAGQSSGRSSLVAGTLVVVAPSRDGLIVAADSRARMDGAVCDSYHKITEPDRPDRTVFVVLGRSIYLEPPPSGLPEPCTYLRQAPRLYDINVLVKTYLETSGANVATMGTEQLAARCIEAIAAMQKTHGDYIRAFWDTRMFTVILATYAPAERTSTVKWFSLLLSPTGEPFVSEKETEVFGPTNRGMVLRFGQSEFFQKQVLNGPGRQFLGRAWKEWTTKARIADIDRSVALNAAVEMIEATAKTAKLLRADVDIGGPIDAVLLGDQARPQRLRWKGP
jgi:hypothetical protein